MRLIDVIDANFRKHARTIYAEWRKQNKTADMGPGDVVHVVSMSGNQVMWIYRPIMLWTSPEKKLAREAIVWQQLYIPGGSWSPYMIADYAKEAGLLLTNVRLFEEHFKRRFGR